MPSLHKTLALAAVATLTVPTATNAQDHDFTYAEGGFIAGFVNDVEESGTFTGNGALDLETDSGAGGFIGGAWQFQENLHLFGEYSLAGQDLEVTDGVVDGEGEFDVVRWRIGVGYAHSLSPTASVYGRLSIDNAELKDFQVDGFNLNASVDDDGIGGEVGVLWTTKEVFHLQGHVRFTSVGEVLAEGSEAFDSDILLGLNGRWFIRPDIALVTGYEFGKITTWNVGERFTF
jgi:hypothetical protein